MARDPGFAGRRWGRGLLVGLVVLATAAPAARAQTAQPLAVVVHQAVAVDNLTTAELRRLLLGDREFWPSGERVTIVIRAPVARERDAIVRDVCELTEAQFRKHWIGKLFRAETPTGPRIVSSVEAALDTVRATPGAITFVAANAVGTGMKVVAIDGRRPGDANYRFR
jgi:hypothetical protein